MHLVDAPTDIVKCVQEHVLRQCIRSAWRLSATCKFMRSKLDAAVVVLRTPWIICGPNARGTQLVVRVYDNSPGKYSSTTTKTVAQTRLSLSTCTLTYGHDGYFGRDTCLRANIVDPRISYTPKPLCVPPVSFRLQPKAAPAYAVDFGRSLQISFHGRPVTHRESLCAGPRDNNDLIEYEVIQLERINGLRVTMRA